jgi:hypothetical protein
MIAMDYENMSDEELYFLLKERMPAVAEIGGDVGDSNRQTVVAFLKLLPEEPRLPADAVVGTSHERPCKEKVHFR